MEVEIEWDKLPVVPVTVIVYVPPTTPGQTRPELAEDPRVRVGGVKVHAKLLGESE